MPPDSLTTKGCSTDEYAEPGAVLSKNLKLFPNRQRLHLAGRGRMIESVTCHYQAFMNSTTVIANGQEIPLPARCSLEEFLCRQSLPPRSVIVEHNGEAVAPSEFSRRQIQAGDRLEIVKIVAGG